VLRLGIWCHYHDSAAAILDDSEIKFAIEEERLSRRFPALVAARGLQACGVPINDTDLDSTRVPGDPGSELRKRDP
jgi:predicted NodU family carbamoyl transferase